MRVAVVGGGFAGLAAVRALDHEHDVTLIEPKDYFEYTPGTLRSLVEPERYRRLSVELEKCIGASRWMRGSALRIEGKKVVVKMEEGEEEVDFDACIVATGSSYNIGSWKAKEMDLENRLRALAAEAAQVAAARKLLVIGGGAVGVELAAELAVEGHDVVLASSSSRLLPSLPEAAGEAAEIWMREQGVELLFGERVREEDGKWIFGDKVLPGIDMAYLCAGLQPTKIPIGSREKKLKRGKRVKGGDREDGSGHGGMEVDAWMQLKGKEGEWVFAAGDVAECKGQGELLAHGAELQGMVIAESVRAIAKSPETPHLRSYPQDLYGSSQFPRLMIISLGPDVGILVLNNVVITSLPTVAAWMKWFIETTKIAQAQRQTWAELLWILGDVMGLCVLAWL